MYRFSSLSLWRFAFKNELQHSSCSNKGVLQIKSSPRQQTRFMRADYSAASFNSDSHISLFQKQIL